MREYLLDAGGKEVQRYIDAESFLYLFIVVANGSASGGARITATLQPRRYAFFVSCNEIPTGRPAASGDRGIAKLNENPFHSL